MVVDVDEGKETESTPVQQPLQQQQLQLTPSASVPGGGEGEVTVGALDFDGEQPFAAALPEEVSRWLSFCTRDG